jgi:hypothetical protein
MTMTMTMTTQMVVVVVVVHTAQRRHGEGSDGSMVTEDVVWR